MSEEKQIEEMAKITKAHCELDNQCGSCHWETCNECLAEVLYNAGYHKQSEGKWILTGTFKSTFPLPVANLYPACSICRWIPPKYGDDYKKYNYCPNCGAKMKGGAE